MAGRAGDLFERLEAGGSAALDALLADRMPEQLFMDYKRSADDGGAQRLHDDDNKNLSKAISGFGNAEGGILIWGVANNLSKPGLDDAHGFRMRLEAATSRVSIPVHSGVLHHHWCTEGARGFAVSLIPKADFGPIRAVARELDSYYIRAGESFVVLGHDTLAGLFGRPPRGVLLPKFRSQAMTLLNTTDKEAHLCLGLAVHNPGPILVERPYATINPAYRSAPGVVLHVQAVEPSRVDIHDSSIGSFQIVAKEQSVIAPGFQLDMCNIFWTIGPRVTAGIHLDIVLGGRSVAPVHFEVKCERDWLADAYKMVAAGKPVDSDLVLQLTQLASKLGQS